MARVYYYFVFCALKLVCFNVAVSEGFQSIHCCKNPPSTRLLLSSQNEESFPSSSSILFQNKVSQKDRDDVFDQLGYIPTNLVSIAAKRGGGIETPMVLKTYPLNGGAARRKQKAEGQHTPFPTLYWFCCKEIGKAISELERRGYVGKLEERLRNEPSMLGKFIDSHDSYAKERWDTLSTNHKEYVSRSEGMVKILQYSGVAGTDYQLFQETKRPSIKCLHAHYAHYRGQLGDSAQTHDEGDIAKEGDGINIVGAWVHELLEQEFTDLIL
jgi:hypothetical protein